MQLQTQPIYYYLHNTLMIIVALCITISIREYPKEALQPRKDFPLTLNL